jgi:hypothetical protein
LELLRFYAETYVRIAKDLMDLQVCLQIDEGTDEESDARFKKGIAANLKIARIGCIRIGLQVSAKHAEQLLLALDMGMLTSHDIKALHENIERELSCHFFVGIPPDRIEAFTKSLVGWEEIATKFPAATEDIEEMSKCFALCRYSAAVFHSLMVVEHGLVRLGKMLNVTDPKEGWDASCNKLQKSVSAGRSANDTGLEFSFLEQLNASVQAIKFAWRNKVNHATGKPIIMSGGFAPYVAEEIISATRAFMRRLTEGIS